MWTLNDIYNVLNTRITNAAKRTGAFMEPPGRPTVGTMHTLNDIMTLVTNRAPVPKTGQTTSYGTGDDGALKIGVAWPNPRFSVVGAPGTAETNQIRDNLTGLIWARHANIASGTVWSVNGTCTWATANNVITNSTGPVNGANYGGTNDWRFSNARELFSLIDWKYSNPALSDGTGTNQWTEARGPFTDVKNAYWTSTTYVPNPGNEGWYVSLNISGGVLYRADKTTASYYVWPVRGGR